MTNEQHAQTIFSIGSQQAGAIYQAAGDQFIDHTQGTTSNTALDLLSTVRAAVTAAAPELSPADQRAAAEALDTAADALRGPSVDRRRAAHSLARVARILKQAGQLAGSMQALHQLAAWVEPAGGALLGLL